MKLDPGTTAPLQFDTLREATVMRGAKALGLTIPPAILRCADEVIE